MADVLYYRSYYYSSKRVILYLFAYNNVITAIVQYS